MDVLPARLAWYIAGPLLGLVVVGMYAFANKPLGATGAYANVLAAVRGRVTQSWLVIYFLGLLGGAFAAGLLSGGPEFTSYYGTLRDEVPLVALVPILVVAGAVMGYGARWAGGCTSGHGLRGSASLSPASLVATGTFMATAVAVTGILHLATGGAI